MPSFHGGRRLFAVTIVLQDWGAVLEDRSAQYWELFLDLILVAAASCVADQYKESENFVEFTSFALILINGWMLYTHHITTRFEDASLSHSLLLFLYFAGFGYSIVNVGYEHATAFACGALLQRISILAMLTYTACTVPRARYSCRIIASIMVIPMLCFVIILVWGGYRLAVIALAVAAGAEFLFEFFLTFCVNRQASVPINIEHTIDRLGALQLVMLGETASSVTIAYRETKAHIDDVERSAEENYYWVLILSFLLIFMLTLLYFHMQPRGEDHAFRQSVYTYGIGLMLHKSLSLAFLALGVSIKIVVEAVLSGEKLSMFGYKLFGFGLGAALFCLYLIRLLHHGRKTTLQFSTDLVWTKGVDPSVDRIALLWWVIVGVSWTLPIVGVWTDVIPHDPLGATTLYALFVFFLCIMESSLSHIMGNKLATNVECHESVGEQQSLLHDGKGPTIGQE